MEKSHQASTARIPGGDGGIPNLRRNLFDIHKIGDCPPGGATRPGVDEAHGAHFPYGRSFRNRRAGAGGTRTWRFRVSTRRCQLTQTALLHVGGERDRADPMCGYWPPGTILQIYQSSGRPMLMASIENAVWLMEQLRLDQGAPNAIDRYMERMGRLRDNLSKMRCLRLVGEWQKAAVACGTRICPRW